jgi:hypothetical protein
MNPVNCRNFPQKVARNCSWEAGEQVDAGEWIVDTPHLPRKKCRSVECAEISGLWVKKVEIRRC